MNELTRLIPFLKKYKGWLSLSIFSNIFLSIFTVLSVPVIIPFFQILFNSQENQQNANQGSDIEVYLRTYFTELIQNEGKEQALLMICILISLVFLFRNLFRYLALYCMAPVRNGVVADLRSAMYHKFLSLPPSFFIKHRRGDLISRVSSDVQEVEWSILNVIEAIFKAPLIMIGCIIFMFMTSVKLSIFMMVLLVVVVVIIGGISKSLKKTSTEVQSKLGFLSAMVEESLNGLKIIQGFNAERYMSKRFDANNKSYRDLLTKLLHKRDLSVPTSEFLGVSVVAVLLWYGTTLVFKGELYPETFFAFVFAFYQLIEPGKSFSSAFYNIQKGAAALNRIEEVTLYKNDEVQGVNKIESFRNSIKFENVSFKYPGEDVFAIRNFNLDVKKGEVIAIVGPSGAGKTTLSDLLIRFIEPTEGKILLDGKDLKDCTLLSSRSLFGLVTQEAILFNDSIENNITFGQENDKGFGVVESAKIANSDEFIKQTVDGYQTNIGDKGMKLSGGQRQRLTLARAINKNPEIFILDEATSALDSESEILIQKALDQIMNDKTVFVIAHRLSTIKKADKIVVIDHGNIVEMGRHADLIDLGGTYNSMIENQKFVGND